MKVFRSAAIVTFVLLALDTGIVEAVRFGRSEAVRQNQVFRKYWGVDLKWRFEDLPASGSVPEYRLPYAGSIYPDRQGGTHGALRKYDRAFHSGRPLAVSYEKHDIKVHEQSIPAGPFGVFKTRGTPEWAGHCNGWAAAAIRHAEPRKNVMARGVVFTPADIKGLLAEVYVYGEIERLGGEHGVVNPGILHVILANWIGRGQHAIAMDSTPGEEIWNYPVYAYQSSSAKHSPRLVEVNVNIGYVDYTEQEFDQGPENYKFMSFHYGLELDALGRIVGGSYYRDSSRIDLLWVPVNPTRSGALTANKNPHVDVKTVLALWRASAAEDVRKKWVTIDPLKPERTIARSRVARTVSPANRRDGARDLQADKPPNLPNVAIEDAESRDPEFARSAGTDFSDYIFVR